jgi:hypothetical protein
MGEIDITTVDNGGKSGVWAWRMGEAAFIETIDCQLKTELSNACPLNDSPSNDIPLESDIHRTGQGIPSGRSNPNQLLHQT